MHVRVQSMCHTQLPHHFAWAFCSNRSFGDRFFCKSFSEKTKKKGQIMTIRQNLVHFHQAKHKYGHIFEKSFYKLANLCEMSKKSSFGERLSKTG